MLQYSGNTTSGLTVSGNTAADGETRIANTFSKFTAIHRPWRKLHGGTFARRTFLRFRYCSIHVKIHVLLTYSAVKRRVSMGSRNLVPAVSPMSGSPTFDTEKKKKRGHFKTPPRLRQAE